MAAVVDMALVKREVDRVTIQPTKPGVAGAVTALEEAGYLGSLRIEGDTLFCSTCREHQGAGDSIIDYVFRFEGSSDPDEEAVVFGLRCGRCSTLATLVSSYGPMLNAQEAAIIAALVDGRPHR